MKLSILNGRVLDPANRLDAVTDIHIAEGKILKLGSAPPDFAPDQRLEVKGLVVCPGLVDLSVRLREPGSEYKATIAGEARAAACNGITTLCCPPDTDPPIDTPAVAELLQQRAAKQPALSHIYPLAALTRGLEGSHLAEIGDLKEAGCVGVSNALEPIVNTEVLRNALAYAANFDLTVFVQPREPWLGRHGCAHEGPVSTVLGLAGIPEASETLEVSRHLLLAEITGARLHFCRLSSRRAVELVREARQRGLPVTADVCIHQLFLTQHDLGSYDSQYHLFPPPRAREDREGLRQGLREGWLDAICSDHQPHEPDAKLAPFAATAPGLSGLDTLLPLSLRLAREMELPLLDLINLLTWQPARILGIEAGSLSTGALADICVFDPEHAWTLTPETMHSHRYNTPFLGREFLGKTRYTLIEGEVVYQDRQSAY